MWRKPAQGPRPDYLTPANETLLATAIERQEFVSFKDMEPSLIRLDTPEQVQLAYAEVASAVDYIQQAKGPSGIRDVLSQVNRLSTAEAIEAVMGVPLDGFEADWRRFVQGQGLSGDPGQPHPQLQGGAGRSNTAGIRGVERDPVGDRQEPDPLWATACVNAAAFGPPAPSIAGRYGPGPTPPSFSTGWARP